MIISRMWKRTDRIGFGLLALLLVLGPWATAVHAVRPGEVSWTAEGVLAYRAIGAMAPDEKIRNPDYLAIKFVTPAYWHYNPFNPNDYEACMKVMRAYRIDTYYLVNARTRMMDEILQTMARDGLDQVVVLGAGFDTRAYRFAEKMKNVRFFELDLPATLERKKEMVRKALGSVPDYVAFAPIDFNTETIEEALVRAGYDPEKKTYFVWEGVTMYITEAAVEGTLRFIATRSAPGSAVAFDYLMAGVAARDWERYPKARISAAICALHGEPWIFGFPEPSANAFVEKCGLEVIEDYSAEGMAAKYMAKSDGKIEGRPGTHWRLMHARVPKR